LFFVFSFFLFEIGSGAYPPAPRRGGAGMPVGVSSPSSIQPCIWKMGPFRAKERRIKWRWVLEGRMNWSAPRAVRRRFFMAFGHAMRLAWPVLSAILAVQVVLGLLIGLLEGWSVGDSIYFTFVTGQRCSLRRSRRLQQSKRPRISLLAPERGQQTVNTGVKNDLHAAIDIRLWK
jgi:hypothetical protein